MVFYFVTSYYVYVMFLCYCRLLGKVMWDYRGERWWPLLTSILETSLKCAYLTAKVQDYVINCIELIGPCILGLLFENDKI